MVVGGEGAGGKETQYGKLLHLATFTKSVFLQCLVDSKLLFTSILKQGGSLK